MNFDNELEIENVKQAVAVPIFDVVYGQRPVLFVDMGGNENEDQIYMHLKKKLPQYKLPIRILKIPDDLKINRSKLITIAEEKVNSKFLL